ncbi:hypothetical protein CMT41_07345 [Colwellia sp. MT41]|uniref:Bifunctional diguanylate cyclase/phosphodiesterase n=1 Tax=Colwellia marinimaniae TaxID=1513592 RepID=A0ABQ0MZV7_9GAMM|nr:MULTISPECIES: sensor domain-containing diguanylate cyclase [Colwellia]ALO34551.1 hypothetical protein CMT41_07345 [Colwellia sp. MT41]GAW97854.1 bifunctional diguanylate cyclase/phosphodiesterase [Colwellia marinimaniae]
MVLAKKDECLIVLSEDSSINQKKLIDNNGNTILIVDKSWSDEQIWQALDIANQAFNSGIMVANENKSNEIQRAINVKTSELSQQIRDNERSELLLKSLYRISELTNGSLLDIDTFYGQIHNIVGKLINTSNFYIAKYDKKTDYLYFEYYRDGFTDEAAKKFFKPRELSNHYTELVIRSGEIVLLSRDEMEELYRKGEVVKARAAVRSWLGVPLIHSGEVHGAMVVQSYQKDFIYNQSDAELLNFVSQHVSTAIKRREVADFELQNRNLLEHTASHDSLTNLPNRASFFGTLSQEIAYMKLNNNYDFAILFLDLDGFKAVNDTYGHHVGDSLLKIVAKKLKGFVRNNDTVARLGGDEFVIIIKELIEKETAFEIAKRITKTLALPIMIENNTVIIGTSIGILFSDDSYDSADIMLRDADAAMYRAKEKGKGRFEVFTAIES